MISPSSWVCTEANTTLLNRKHRTTKRAAARTPPYSYGFIAHSQHTVGKAISVAAEFAADSAGSRAQSDRSESSCSQRYRVWTGSR